MHPQPPLMTCFIALFRAPTPVVSCGSSGVGYCVYCEESKLLTISTPRILELALCDELESVESEFAVYDYNRSTLELPSER